MEDSEIKRIVEALIFASDMPLTEERIKETLQESNGFDADAVVSALNDEYAGSGRAFVIQKVAGGYLLATRPEYAGWIRQLYIGRHKSRLSQAALETLAIVAFKQPVSRVEVAQIRGVDPDGVLKNLLDRRLITISGRAEGLGRPLLYTTTPEFLQYFGLNDLSQLPKPREIEELFGKGDYSEEFIEALSRTETLDEMVDALKQPAASPPASPEGSTDVPADAPVATSTALEHEPIEPPSQPEPPRADAGESAAE